MENKKTDQTESALLQNEQRIFDALADVGTVKQAALKLGVKTQTLYNWIYAMKNKYKRRKAWVLGMRVQMVRTSLLRKLFSERVQLEPDKPVLHQLEPDEDLERF